MDLTPIINEAIKVAAPYVVPALTAGLCALGGLVGRWIHEHTSSSKTLTALASGTDYVGAAVAHVLDAVRPEITQALSDDGRISPAEAQAIKAKVVQLVMAELPPALQDVAKAMGPSFSTWLSGKVGSEVSQQLVVESKFAVAVEAMK